MLGVGLPATVGCAGAGAVRLDDARVAFAVRSALVNDSAVGLAVIDITVVDGVVTLEGRMPSEAERLRALEVTRAVQGVRRIEDRISIGPGPAAVGPAGEASPRPPDLEQRGRMSTLTTEYERRLPHHLAVGGVFTKPLSKTSTLDGLPSIGPVFRLGRGAGLRPVLTLTRLRADLPEALGTDAFGELRLLVLGGGLGYAFVFDRWSVSVGGSAAWSFNHIRLEPGPAVPVDRAVPVAASSSPAAQGGATLWYEASRRVSVGLSGAYLLTRPQATWLQANSFFRRRLDADTVLISAGVAWWLF
jgi:hypothetical protein